jgi:heme/copper-type cytochrome/quinol oxidase subunit 3
LLGIGSARQPLIGAVHEIPENVYGSAALTWWAVMSLMLIEGTTLALCAGAYLYVRQNYFQWPPEHTPLPSLTIPLINLALMLVTIVPAVMVFRSARAHDRKGVLIGASVQGLLGVVIMVLRYYECMALNVRFDTNAYGSVAWAVLVGHALVMITDVMDTLGLALMFALEEPEEKHFVDACENTQFWYFVVASWVPLFALVFLYPRG